MAVFEALRALHKARSEYPRDLQGQQRHFAQTLPTACTVLETALTDEFSESELRTLRDALQDMYGDDPEEDDPGVDA